MPRPARSKDRLSLFPLIATLLCLFVCFLQDAPAQDAVGPPQPDGTNAAPARQDSFPRSFVNHLKQTVMAKSFDVYLPFLEYHNRYVILEREEDEGFNEFAYGFGLGKSIRDEDGDTHALAAMVFADSLYNPQWYAGYLFTKNFEFDDAGDFRLGLGFTLGLTGRKEYQGKELNYFPPLPLALPVISLEYKDVALQVTSLFYGEGGQRSILFAWLRVRAFEW